jgi:hypothetical protein
MTINIRLILLITAILVLSQQTFPHHQLGLPHYLYSEDYPQIPTMVIDADAEGYTVTFSTYPGNPKPGETVRIKIYIKHTLTGKVYTSPISISVSRLTFFGGERQLVAPKKLISDYNQYKMSYQFDDAEKYLINITFQPRNDFFEKIPFPIIIGKTNFNVIPIIFGVILLLVFIAVGFIKRNKDKEQAISEEIQEEKELGVTESE